MKICEFPLQRVRKQFWPNLAVCSVALKGLEYKIFSFYIQWRPYNGRLYFAFPPCLVILVGGICSRAHGVSLLTHGAHSGRTQKSNAICGFRRLDFCKNLKRKLARLTLENVHTNSYSSLTNNSIQTLLVRSLITLYKLL